MHDRFGTSTVELGGHSYDIARARRETYAWPGALPDVTPATLDEDLRRRDFTVNAIAIALTGPGAGELHERLRWRSRISTPGRCESCTTAASSTTRRDCCG